jgi:hypothetical protein
VEQGRVVLSYTPEVIIGDAVNRYLLDAVDAGQDYGWRLYHDADDENLRWSQESAAGAGDVSSSAALAWAAGTTYEIDARWWANGVVKVWRDGVLVIDDTATDVADQIDTSAYLGSFNGTSNAQGRLKLIEVSK